MNERSTFSPRQQSSSIQPTRRPDTRHSDFNNQRVQQEHKKRQEEDDFRVPIFDQQSGTNQNRSVNHQNRENERVTPFGAPFSARLANVHNVKPHSNKFQKENSQGYARSPSNQPSRQNVKAPLKETNESSSFNVRNGSNSRNLRDCRADTPQVDNTTSGYGNNSVMLREIQEEGLRSPNDAAVDDAVSENSMVDSICGVDISPDDVVGIIGQKHFWKARRAIVK